MFSWRSGMMKAFSGMPVFSCRIHASTMTWAHSHLLGGLNVCKIPLCVYAVYLNGRNDAAVVSYFLHIVRGFSAHFRLFSAYCDLFSAYC